MERRRRTLGRRVSVLTSHLVWWMAVGGTVLHSLRHH
jgi:hypothetical protein